MDVGAGSVGLCPLPELVDDRRDSKFSSSGWWGCECGGEGACPGEAPSSNQG